MLLENGKRKYMTHSIITKLFSGLMNRFVFKFWGPFLQIPQTHLQMKMVQYFQVLDLEGLLWIID